MVGYVSYEAHPWVDLAHYRYNHCSLLRSVRGSPPSEVMHSELVGL